MRRSSPGPAPPGSRVGSGARQSGRHLRSASWVPGGAGFPRAAAAEARGGRGGLLRQPS